MFDRIKFSKKVEFPDVFGPLEVPFENGSVSGHAVSVGEEIVLSWETSPHFLQVEAQQVFSGNVEHA